MIQVNPHNDVRYDNICCYCQKPFDNNKTRDHIPSKVLLDKPYPENLPRVFCCYDCNQSFSTDEEYFACIIEYLVAGTKTFEKIQRKKIKDLLLKKEHLRNRIELNITEKGDQLTFDFTNTVLKNVLKKIMFGHLSYELSNPYIQNPDYLEFNTIDNLTEKEFQNFILESAIDIVPEIGTRASLSHIVINNCPISTWKIVQKNNYQYKLSIGKNETILKVIFRNKIYLLAIWNS